MKKTIKQIWSKVMEILPRMGSQITSHFLFPRRDSQKNDTPHGMDRLPVNSQADQLQGKIFPNVENTNTHTEVGYKFSNSDLFALALLGSSTYSSEPASIKRIDAIIMKHRLLRNYTYWDSVSYFLYWLRDFLVRFSPRSRAYRKALLAERRTRVDIFCQSYSADFLEKSINSIKEIKINL